jgi:hypothetical protein
MMSQGLYAYIFLITYSHLGEKMSFEEKSRELVRARLCWHFFQRNKSDQFRDLPTWSDIHLRVFHRECSTRSYKREDAKSAPESGGPILLGYGQFHVPHWSEDYRRNLRCEAWTPSPASLVSRSESVRLLALWNVEGNDEGSSIPIDWKILEAVILIWNALSVEQLYSVFLNWMEHLEWLIANGGGYYIAWH